MIETLEKREPKRSFDIDQMLAQIEKAVAPFPKAAMFELYDDGYRSVFEQLMACIISIRTRDERTVPIAHKLFASGRTPQEVASLSERELNSLIGLSSFHEAKARTIHNIAIRTVEEFGGELPCYFETLTAFAGVGPKCANLALGVAGGMGGIAVDIHVHRVTNRWGYVSAITPEATMAALEKALPRKYWVDINRLLVPFGKHLCTRVLPHCSACPVLEYCRQVGVKRHR